LTLDLFDYQAQAADIMASRDRFGLHDEMGIGKTATTIGAIDRTLSERGIIVCPAMLRENWITEFRKFSKFERRIAKGKNIHDFVAWSRGRFDILVTSYEQATKWTPKFIEEGEFVDFIAFDEAHYLKNVNANRTRALLGHEASGADGMVEWAEHAWHVTGTPMANDPLDVYTFLRFAKAVDIDSYDILKYFIDVRFGTYSARDFVKVALRTTLLQPSSTHSVPGTHTDVDIHLPPRRLQQVLLQ